MPLRADLDVIDVAYLVEQGRLTSFVLNLRSFIGERWREVKRYDTCREHLHAHTFWHGEQVERLEDEPTADYTLLAAQASNDLRKNYLEYRRFMEE